MTELFASNSLNPHKTVKFNLTLRYIGAKNVRGEHIWVLELGTTRLDINGDEVPSKKVHLINVNDLDDVIQSMVSELCTYIDWTPLLIDKYPPYVSETTPEDGTTVSIDSNVYIIIKDDVPFSGVDLSDMKVVINNSVVDIDITDEVKITGSPFESYKKCAIRPKNEAKT